MKTFIFIFGLLVSLVGATVLLAEQAAEPSDRRDRARGGQRVMLVREAKQPQGFPRPTAVGQIVVKEYPTYRAARVESGVSGQNSMFRALFNHIKKNNISMTAPVEMEYGETGASSMSFLYSSQNIGNVGRDGSVQVVDVPAMTVVSLGVRGSYTKKRFDNGVKRLETWLDENKDRWRPAGEARYLAFNSPFVPSLLKYGEIQIPIRSTDAPAGTQLIDGE
jgi:hypothetical protein